jgi:hypothetical protein
MDKSEDKDADIYIFAKKYNTFRTERDRERCGVRFFSSRKYFLSIKLKLPHGEAEPDPLTSQS